MPNINLLPKQTSLLKSNWITNSLFFLVFSIVCFYLLKQYQNQKKQTLVLVPEMKSKTQETGLLDTYFLRQLVMVGFLKSKNPETAALGLLKSPDRKILTVKLGDCIGKEKARITCIEEKKIVLQLPDQTTKRFIRLSN